MKNLVEVTKGISSGKLNGVEVLRSIDAMMLSKPSSLTRIIYERAFFPDTPPLINSQEQDGPINTRDYFFYGSKHQIKITEFLKPEVFLLYPVSKDYWDY